MKRPLEGADPLKESGWATLTTIGGPIQCNLNEGGRVYGSLVGRIWARLRNRVQDRLADGVQGRPVGRVWGLRFAVWG